MPTHCFLPLSRSPEVWCPEIRLAPKTLTPSENSAIPSVGKNSTGWLLTSTAFSRTQQRGFRTQREASILPKAVVSASIPRPVRSTDRGGTPAPRHRYCRCRCHCRCLRLPGWQQASAWRRAWRVAAGRLSGGGGSLTPGHSRHKLGQKRS